METMYHTPDTEALLNCDSLRGGVLRCLHAYHERPLLGIVERRRGRGSLVSAERSGGKEKSKAKVQFATYSQLHRRYCLCLLTRAAASVGVARVRSVCARVSTRALPPRAPTCVHTRARAHARTHSRCQYMRSSMSARLLLPTASKCGVLCRASVYARQVCRARKGKECKGKEWGCRVSGPFHFVCVRQVHRRVVWRVACGVWCLAFREQSHTNVSNGAVGHQRLKPKL